MSPLVLALVLSSNPFLEEAKGHYDALDFEKCVGRLQQAVRWKDSTPQEQRDVELYAGLCRFNLGHRKAAIEHFRTALRIDEAAGLPPMSSPKAEALFLKVKEKLRAPPEDFPDEDLPADAPVRTDIAPSRVEQVSLTVPAWKRHAAPIALGTVAAASLVACVGLGLHARGLEQQANASLYESDFRALGGAAQANATAANVALGVALTTAAAGAVIYFLTGDPPPPSAAPTAP